MYTLSNSASNLRRLRPTELQRLQAALQQAAAFAAAYPNSPKLWEMVRIAIDQLLFAEWRAGRLLGQRASEAYFVRCDVSTMTQADIAGRRLIAMAGVALVKPGEFQILTIAQTTAA
jgi:phage tail sheath protein FI